MRGPVQLAVEVTSDYTAIMAEATDTSSHGVYRDP